jgi:hypothetical protein
VSARGAARLWVQQDDRLYDDHLGNIDVRFTGVESVLFSIEAGEGKYEPQALFEFDEADHLVHQVEYMFGSLLEMEKTWTYENGRLVGWSTRSALDPASLSESVISYDDAGRVLSTRQTVNGSETFSATVEYLSRGQVALQTTELLEGTKSRRSNIRFESNDSGRVTKE